MAYNTRIVLLVSVAMTMVLGLSEAFDFHEKELESDESLWALYERWCSHHNMLRDVDEKGKRFNVFKEKAKHVHMFNQMDKPYKLGLNKFSDLTSNEFWSLYGGGSKNSNHGMRVQLKAASNTTGSNHRMLAELPEKVDWRDKGAVGPVKNQGQCNSSWAFSATGAIEAIHQIKTGELLSLSEQQLIDCDTSNEHKGCAGGATWEAFKYVIDAGLTTEDAYPYNGSQSECSFEKSSAKVSIRGFSLVPEDNEGALLEAVARQPVSVAIETGRSDQLASYTGGVFSDSSCNSDRHFPDHSVLIVGYGTENGNKYWIVNNSWGEEGYFRIIRGVGTCGIESDPYFPYN